MSSNCYFRAHFHDLEGFFVIFSVDGELVKGVHSLQFGLICDFHIDKSFVCHPYKYCIQNLYKQFKKSVLDFPSLTSILTDKRTNMELFLAAC